MARQPPVPLTRRIRRINTGRRAKAVPPRILTTVKAAVDQTLDRLPEHEAGTDKDNAVEFSAQPPGGMDLRRCGAVFGRDHAGLAVGPRFDLAMQAGRVRGVTATSSAARKG